jgi:hypothetical protein
MAEEIVLSLKIDGADKAITSIDQLEREVAQLEETMRTADFGSQAFKDAEKELKAANAELYKFDRQLEAIQDPVAAQEKWVKYGEGVAGAFAAAQGAAAIFGVESENVEKMVVKAQGAVSIAMGARMLAESQLLTVIKNSSIAQAALNAATAVSTAVFGTSTKAVKLFRTALISTGIGAIAVAVGLLVANWDKLVAGFRNAADQLLKLVPGLSKVTGFFSKLIGKVQDVGAQLNLLPSQQEMANRKMAKQAEERLAQIDREKKQEIELVKAKGEDATELERKYLKQRVDLTRTAFGEVSEEYDDALHALDMFEAQQTKTMADASSERAKKRNEDKAQELEDEEAMQLRLLEMKAEQTKSQEDFEALQAELRERDLENFKGTAEQKLEFERLRKEQEKKANEDFKAEQAKIQQEKTDKQNADTAEQEKKDQEDLNRANQHALKIAEIEAGLDGEITTDEKIELQRLQHKARLDALSKEDRANQELVRALEQEHQQKLAEIREQADEASLEKAKEKQQNRLALAQAGMNAITSIGNALMSLSEANDKEGEVSIRKQKARARQKLIMDQANAIMGAVAGGMTQPFPANIFAVATGVAAVMANFANAKKAMSQIGADVADGGTEPGPPSVSTPTFSAPTATGGGEAGGAEAAEQAFQTAGRAYVLDSDVSSGLEAQQRINDLASL